ncbi:MAG: hypothetical protein ACRD2L_16235 [Terriglobia bacterium]
MFPKMAELIKPSKIGCATIEHYTVTKLDVLRELMHGAPCEEGTIAVLRVNGKTMMSDTRHERLTNWEIQHRARGNVLLAGLGIGMILHPILEKEEVTSVTVVEKEADVIALIAPTLPKSKKLTLVCADIFTWKPPVNRKYDCIYFDIWADASNGAATPDRRKLSARFHKYKALNGWMSSWHPMSYR